MGEERALRSAVAFAERMQGVYLAQMMSYPFDKVVAVKAAKIAVFLDRTEHFGRRIVKELWQAERVGTRDADGSEIASPIVDVLEQDPVKPPKVTKVVSTPAGAGQREERPPRR